MPNSATYTVQGPDFHRDWTSLKRTVTLLVEAEKHLATLKASESLKQAANIIERAEAERARARANYETAVRRLQTTVTGVYVPYNPSLDTPAPE